MARARKQGVEPRIDPRMAAGTDTTYVTFLSELGEEDEENADSPGPNGLASTLKLVC